MRWRNSVLVIRACCRSRCAWKSRMRCVSPGAWRWKSPAGVEAAMARAFIGVGSNIEPAQNVRAATHALARRLPLVGISTVYLTDALGDAAQPPYYNCVLEVN